MRKVIFSGFVVFSISMGALYVIYKNLNSLRGVDHLDAIVLVIGLVALISFIAMLKGIHFSARKHGITR